MSDKPKNPTPQGPCEAERLWFEASDRFYWLLNRRGQGEALRAVREVLEVVPPLPEPAREYLRQQERQ